MNLDAVWHDLECGPYAEDLPLWRALARETGGPVLDVGAGTGRVSLDLAAAGFAVVALDREPALLAAARRRAAGLTLETVVADARRFALGRRFALIVVPMQTLQLLEGAAGRAEFFRRAREHLRPGGLLAAAVADALDSFDEEHPLPPPPAALEIAGVRYASQLLSVAERDGRAVIHRRREMIGPGDEYSCCDVTLPLDRVSADAIATEAERFGFRAEAQRFVPETDAYLGAAVVVLRAA